FLTGYAAHHAAEGFTLVSRIVVHFLKEVTTPGQRFSFRKEWSRIGRFPFGSETAHVSSLDDPPAFAGADRASPRGYRAVSFRVPRSRVLLFSWPSWCAGADY